METDEKRPTSRFRDVISEARLTVTESSKHMIRRGSSSVRLTGLTAYDERNSGLCVTSVLLATRVFKLQWNLCS